MEEDEYAPPIGSDRDDYLSDMLRVGMRLRNEYGEDDDEEDGDDEDDREDVDQWDVASKSSSAGELMFVVLAG